MGLDDHLHAAAVEPAGLCHRDRRPGEPAGALRFAALDSERDFTAAGITQNDFEFRAQHGVQHRRIIGSRTRATRRDDQILLQDVVESLHRRIRARDADVNIVIGAAEIMELAGIMFHRRQAEKRFKNDARLESADDRAILGRDIVNVVGGDIAARARHVGNDDVGIARHMLAHMAGDQPRIGVIAATGRGSDNDLNGFAAIEVFDILRRFLRGCCSDRRSQDKSRQSAGKNSRVVPNC